MIDVEIEAAAWTAALADAEALTRAVAEAVLAEERLTDRNLVVLLTDDEAVRALNAQFRDKDKPTNVLSFPAPPNPEQHLGDVALAYETCAREAAEQGKPLAHHLQHLVAHGVLHLLGYDHMTDEEAADMEGLERVVLARLGIPDPYAAGEGDHD
ncbi:rRNA maturation RNase YbeY [Phenylobacterium soli]|uniref:rRNA maturation RNase YbeY n=1 Tax=Phenylobacterium soli TaxID=2170551 RepID=UPI0014022C49|nr:rRNA maturation RNase YbeY [Phenylobacterium soli]